MTCIIENVFIHNSILLQKQNVFLVKSILQKVQKENAFQISDVLGIVISSSKQNKLR